MSEEQDPLLAALEGNAEDGNDNTNTNNNLQTNEEWSSQVIEPLSVEEQEVDPEKEARNKALTHFKKKLLEHRRYDDQLKSRRQNIRDLEK